MRDYYAAMSATPCKMIMNGFDQEKVDRAKPASQVKDDGLVRIRHTGKVSPKRLPIGLFDSMARLREVTPEKAERILLEFYGYSDVFERAMRTEYQQLLDLVSFHETVPHHEVLELMHSADYLLFCGVLRVENESSRGVLTTKLFEYLATGRPILGHTDPTTIAADLVRDCGGDHLISDKTEDYLEMLESPEFYDRKPPYVGANVRTLTRESQAMDYAELISYVVERNPEGPLHVR